MKLTTIPQEPIAQPPLPQPDLQAISINYSADGTTIVQVIPITEAVLDASDETVMQLEADKTDLTNKLQIVETDLQNATDYSNKVAANLSAIINLIPASDPLYNQVLEIIIPQPIIESDPGKIVTCVPIAPVEPVAPLIVPVVELPDSDEQPIVAEGSL